MLRPSFAAQARRFLSTNTRTSITTRTSNKQFLLLSPGVPSSTAPSAFIGSTSSRNMSTEIKQISTPKATQPVAPYSQAIQAGGTIFVSGQIPCDAAGNLVEGSISDKTAACCENLKHILEAAGSSLARVVKVTIFLDSMDHFAEMNSVYVKYFGATKPARSCVAVKELPKGVPVEIEAIALSA